MKPGRHWNWDGKESSGEWDWSDHRRRRGCFQFVIFALGSLTLLILGVIILVILSTRSPGGEIQPDVALLVCGVPTLLILAMWVIGAFVFRRVGTPLVDIMDAADSVAQGDLSVRVPEDVGGEVGLLATRFNRMTAELERSEQQRRNITADVAHELRTPVHIIQGNLEGILDGVYEADASQIQATLEETRLLARLVDDLQTLSLAEAGQLPMHPSTFAVADLLADIVTSFEALAAEQAIVISSETAGELFLTADSGRLDQVLSNLVVNALRHTAAGGSIVLTALADGDDIVMTVADNGEGIASEDLPFIFDRFWRGDRSRTRGEYSGVGLGLAISQRLLEAQGGSIAVESVAGEGTVFTLRLPAAEG